MSGRRFYACVLLSTFAFALGALLVYQLAGSRVDRFRSDPAAPATLPSGPAPTEIEEHPQRGLASISFDDGTAGQAEFAAPLLNRRKLHATFYLISDGLDWGEDYMNTGQAKALARGGHEIGNHTRSHRHLTTLSQSEVDSQFKDAQHVLHRRLGVTPQSCSYPFGDEDEKVRREASKYFRSCRTTAGGINGWNKNPYQLVTLNLSARVTPGMVRKAAEETMLVDGWLILTYHEVGPNASSYESGVSPGEFAAQIDALIASGIRIKTVGSASTQLRR